MKQFQSCLLNVPEGTTLKCMIDILLETQQQWGSGLGAASPTT